MLGRILAICLGLMTACYSPPEPDCGFACRGGQCPTNYTCAADGICHRVGSPASLSCGPDARIDSPVPIDAPRPDADLTPPQVVGTTPANGDVSVPLTSAIHVFFSEPVANVTPASFVVQISSVQVPGTTASQDPMHWVFTPQSLLPAQSMVDVTLTADITDFSGNPLTVTMFSFTTGT